MEINRGDKDYWKKRAEAGAEFFKKQEENRKVGRPTAFDSPLQLWETAMQYFERCDSTPWIKKDWKGKDADEVEVPTTAPYLWSGLDDFCFEKGFCSNLKDYRTAANKKEEDLPENRKYLAKFSEVIRAIGQIISTQKISGGLVNAYNSNLVARIEGLVDKKEDVSKGASKRPKFVFVNKAKK